MKWGIVRKPITRIEFLFATGLLTILTGCQNTPNETAKSVAAVQNLSSEDIASRTIQRRAVEAVIWGIPAVNYDRMYQAMVGAAHGGFNQILYSTRPFD
jgi:hypothetical protein